MPSLRSELSQITLRRYGNLGLRLKMNSHWIFSDICHALYLDQPRSFLHADEKTLNIIDPLVGLSPQLLHVYASVTWETSQRLPSKTSDLRQNLLKITQRLPRNASLSDQENEYLERCAHAYLEGAHIYLLCRRLRSVVPLEVL